MCRGKGGAYDAVVGLPAEDYGDCDGGWVAGGFGGELPETGVEGALGGDGVGVDAEGCQSQKGDDGGGGEKHCV